MDTFAHEYSTGVEVLLLLADHDPIFAHWLSIKSTCKLLYSVFTAKIVPRTLQMLRQRLIVRSDEEIQADQVLHRFGVACITEQLHKMHKRLTNGKANDDIIMTGGFLLQALCSSDVPETQTPIDICTKYDTKMGESDNPFPMSLVSRWTSTQISVWGELPLSEFISSFDFDFCKNMFDGRRLCVLRPDALISHRAIVTRPDIERSRRFIDAKKNEDSILSEVYSARIAKYVARGFDIICDGEAQEFLRDGVVTLSDSETKNEQDHIESCAAINELM